MKDRFEVFPDPLNNWIVWDLDEDNFTEVGTQSLQYLSEGQARAFCSLLNRLQMKPPPWGRPPFAGGHLQSNIG